ncbi:MAG: hypothetical protein WA183_11985 [Chthoniobacterales bacterium]
MGRRKPPKTAGSTKSIPPAQVGDAYKLRHLSKDEAVDAYQAAKKEKKHYGPMNLFEAWRLLRYNPSLPDFVADLRFSINDPDLDNPSKLAEYLARFIELMVIRFERSVEDRLFDSALPRLTALPMLYSPRAGKGASEWEKAKALFDQKKVGTQALSVYRGRDPHTARNPVWGELAENAARIVYMASVERPYAILLRKSDAVAFYIFEKKRPGAKKTVRTTLYLLDDKSVLLWPSWFDLCEGLPGRVSDDTDRYKRAVKAVLDEFFADPKNSFADEVLQKLLESTSGYSRSDAVKQAIKNVLACVGRL